MFCSTFITSISLLVCVGGVDRDAPMVRSFGYQCGGSAIPRYCYPIDSVSYPMVEFRVGTNDLERDHYWNVRMPEGWQFEIDDTPMNHACGEFTPIGEESIGPCWSLTPGSARWWTDDPAYAVEIFTFGFDHLWPPEDVGWSLTTRRPGPPPEFFVFAPFWDAPVGMGEGPLHAPYPPEYACFEHEQCGGDFYCLFYPCAIETGYCMPRPDGCPEIYAPVCGCNGVTYGNACFAAAAGMGIEYEGPCLGSCRADLNDDGAVNAHDLLIVLDTWSQPLSPADLDGNGTVDVFDLLMLLEQWGPCPPPSPFIADVWHSDCLPGPRDVPRFPCDDEAIEFEMLPGQLTIHHRSATYRGTAVSTRLKS
jgi:hypothetical protein